MRRKAFLPLLILVGVTGALALPAIATDPAGYERVLIPIMVRFPRPGLFGSMWVTELSVRNESSNDAEIFQYECEVTCQCVSILCVPQRPVSPHTSFIYRPSLDTHNLHNPGVFMYIGRSAAPDVALQLRVRDLSRSARSLGTELPLVRESEMLTRAAHLLNIPTDAKFRHHLRVYAITTPNESPEVRVRVSDEATDTILSEQVVSLAAVGLQFGAGPDDPTGVPAYGEIPYIASTLPAPISASTVAVAVEPLTPGLRFWAFVSVTNNETQEITTVTPQ